MFKVACFRELKLYSFHDITSIFSIDSSSAEEIILHLRNKNILKCKKDSEKTDQDTLESSELAMGDLTIADSERRYLFDYVGLIEFTINKKTLFFAVFLNI